MKTMGKKKVKGYRTPKDPRIMVTAARHAKLAAEAKRTGLTIAEVLEAKLKKVK